MFGLSFTIAITNLKERLKVLGVSLPSEIFSVVTTKEEIKLSCIRYQTVMTSKTGEKTTLGYMTLGRQEPPRVPYQH